MFTDGTTHAGSSAGSGAGTGDRQTDNRANARARRRWPLALAAVSMTLVMGLTLGASLVVGSALEADAMTGTSAAQTTTSTSSEGSRGSTSSGYGSGYGSSLGGPTGSTGSTPSGTGATSSQSEATAASSSEATGVVLINTDLKYDDASAAGTGMVLTSGGLVMTNNHVVEGATTVTVTDPSTSATYTATVVGTDSEDDVALLQLADASGLTTITVDDDTESVGQDVTAVGNAEGGGELMAADGSITQLDATVTTQSESTTASETLDGMIEISADVVSGDSGGALLDDEGEVIGMTTAASSGTSVVTGYAIPIEDAMTIVDQIRSGDESGGVELGYPAFLGVAVSSSDTATGTNGKGSLGSGSSSSGSSSQGNLGGSMGPGTTRQSNGAASPGWQTQSEGTTSSTTTGASVQEVFEDTPAADAGLEAGDTITAIDGSVIADSDALSTALSSHEPGDSVSVTWTDTAGTSHTATVTSIDGPAA